VPLDAATLRRAQRHLAAADPVLARIIELVGPCRLKPQRGLSPFTYLVAAVVGQQISGAAARAIRERLRARFGHPLRPEQIASAADEELRACGLSRQKAGYLRDLARHAAAGLPLARLGRRSDERVIETLTVVKGIGRWTAEMYLMFRLGRPDVLPLDDLGIQTAMRRAYRMRGKPKKPRMVRMARPWRPYRSVACWYLWRSLEVRPPR